MARNVINRSISFDPELFEKMETYRNKYMLQRSEFIVRCILKEMLSGKHSMTLDEVPPSMVAKPITASRQRKLKRGRGSKD